MENEWSAGWGRLGRGIGAGDKKGEFEGYI